MKKSIFDSWRKKPLDEILTQCRELMTDMEYPTVRRWRQEGGKVLGHFQVYFPEEIAHAAGMLPFKLRGAPVSPRKSDSRFGSYLCSILKTSLELAMNDQVELDMFVTHPICDLYLPQNANSTHAVEYLRNEYQRLLNDIEVVAGRKVREEDLRHSITVFNQNRDLIRKLYAIKRDSPWLISIQDAYALVVVGGMIPREEHNELLEAVLPMVESRDFKRQDKIRVVFEGGFCEQPSLDMLMTMDRYCYLVDDDLLIGLRWILEDVPIDGDPLYNLAEAYLEKSSYSPVQHDLRKQKEDMLLKRIKDAKANAAIVTAAKMCEPGLEEQVAYTHALEEEDMPYFVSEFEENMTSFDHLEIQLETFVENLLFG
jgi:benzoyl-CoA reductase subunit C